MARGVAAGHGESYPAGRKDGRFTSRPSCLSDGSLRSLLRGVSVYPLTVTVYLTRHCEVAKRPKQSHHRVRFLAGLSLLYRRKASGSGEIAASATPPRNYENNVCTERLMRGTGEAKPKSRGAVRPRGDPLEGYRSIQSLGTGPRHGQPTVRPWHPTPLSVGAAHLPTQPPDMEETRSNLGDTILNSSDFLFNLRTRN